MKWGQAVCLCPPIFRFIMSQTSAMLRLSRLFHKRSSRNRVLGRSLFSKPRLLALFAIAASGVMPASSLNAVVLWNEPESSLAHQNGAGRDILAGALKRDDSANDTLYFKFQVTPISDKDTEDYFAAFELFEGDSERLGIG